MEIYRVGGAQAVFALAGWNHLGACADKIVGSWYRVCYRVETKWSMEK